MAASFKARNIKGIVNMFENTKKYLDKFEELKIPLMDIIVYHKGKEVFREFRGVSDEQGTKANGKEIYNLYSCSKVVTCIAALKLLEEGKISLDDDLEKYIPAFAQAQVKKDGQIVKAKNKIKLWHLFTMTAGLNYNVGAPQISQGRADTDGACATVAMMDYLARVPLEFEPGTQWNYSLCHDVLAAVVEVVSGKRFGLWVKENIFDVLGMDNSTFLLPETRAVALRSTS